MFNFKSPNADPVLGGSFGVVYKAFERTTGDVVAIKHVSSRLSSLKCCFVYTVMPPITNITKSTDRP